MSVNILIVDDEKDIRMLVAGILQDEGYNVLEAGNSDEALSLYKSERPDLVILDIWLEGSPLDGMDILKEIREQDSITPVIMMSGHGNIETAVSSIKVGAYDFVEKPFKSDRILLVIKRALENYRLKRENEDLRKQMFGDEELIGTSLSMQMLRQTLNKAAPTHSRIIITGAPGSGKELVAKQIHLKSGRKDAPFMIINCAGLTDDRGEAEIFGEEKNGEVIKTGILEKADGGTVLLDEVHEMPIGIQSKMVRFIQEEGFERLHGNKRIKSDIRFLSSSTKDLLAEVKAGKLREDQKDHTKEEIPSFSQEFESGGLSYRQARKHFNNFSEQRVAVDDNIPLQIAGFTESDKISALIYDDGYHYHRHQYEKYSGAQYLHHGIAHQ